MIASSASGETTRLLWELTGAFAFFSAGHAFLDDLQFEENGFFARVVAVQNGWMRLDWHGWSYFAS